MSTTTTDALDALLYIYNGFLTARWNFPDAVGSTLANPGGVGNAVVVTYSFLEQNPRDSGELGFRKLTDLERVAAKEALEAISEVARIEFVEVAGQLGQLTFGMSYQAGSSAYAYAPKYVVTSTETINGATEDPLGGNVWLNSALEWPVSDWQPGGWGRLVLLHEIGHALGLKHPFQSGPSGTGYTLDPSLDNEAHTVMSYTSAPRTTLVEVIGSEINYTWLQPSLSPSTLMPLDIEALQHLYGANVSTRSGKSIYHWDTNQELLETIWDGGGVDTINCSNQVYSCRIDLHAGTYSSIGLRLTASELWAALDLPSWFTPDNLSRREWNQLYNGKDNLAIAKGVIIENATGGSGNDSIVGNAANNRLFGGDGRDSLTGGLGNDILNGGRSNDILAGQDGNDLLVGGLGADRMSGGAGADVFAFNRLVDLGITLSTADVVRDFVPGVDRIDLSAIDANTSLADNQAFTFIGGADFSSTDSTGQLRFRDGVLYGSTDSDNLPEFMIRLSGLASLSAADFLL